MAKVDVNLNLGQRFSDANVSKARYVMANQMMKDMDFFVPYREGHLSDSAHINANGSEITWSTPYARAQFYGFITNYKTGRQSRIVNYTHKRAGDPSRRWDLRAKALYSQQWADLAKKSLMGGTNGFN